MLRRTLCQSVPACCLCHPKLNQVRGYTTEQRKLRSEVSPFGHSPFIVLPRITSKTDSSVPYLNLSNILPSMNSIALISFPCSSSVAISTHNVTLTQLILQILRIYGYISELANVLYFNSPCMVEFHHVVWIEQPTIKARFTLLQGIDVPSYSFVSLLVMFYLFLFILIWHKTIVSQLKIEQGSDLN